jgi:DNA replication protein DnaC
MMLWMWFAVLLVGPPGVGKSHLAQALGREAIRHSHTVYYRSIFDLVRDLAASEGGPAETRLLARYLKPDLLIIDDMGMKRLPKQSGEYLLEVIMRRYELRSTIMTSNRPLSTMELIIHETENNICSRMNE